MKNKPTELIRWDSQVDRILSHMEHTVHDEKLLSRLLVKYAVLISVFSRQKVPIPHLTANTPVKSCHDQTEALAAAYAMDDFVEEETDLLLIKEDKILEEKSAL